MKVAIDREVKDYANVMSGFSERPIICLMVDIDEDN
jgi:hypothetical protein